MKLRAVGLLVILAPGLLAAPLPADAQQPRKVYRIGWLAPLPPPIATPSVEAFLEELRALGWVEGQHFVMEYRWNEGKDERFPALVAELVGLEVDVIVVVTTAGARAAMRATKTISIVFTVVADPVGSGLVASLARPGGNITGPSAMGPEVTGKQLQMLIEVVPGLSRLAVLWEPTNPGVARIVHQMQRDARALGLMLQSLEVRHPDDTEPAFAAMTRERTAALFVAVGVLANRHRTRIAELALAHQLPTMSNWKDFPRAGGLLSYGPSLRDYFRRAAPCVDKILRGAKPADLPVEQPMRFELAINLKTAKALGLTIPRAVLI